MEKESKIVLIDENGESKEYHILLTFTTKENDNLYVIYTDNTLDDDGFVITYAGIYHENNGKQTLLPVETDEEWALIDKMLLKLEKEDKDEE